MLEIDGYAVNLLSLDYLREFKDNPNEVWSITTKCGIVIRKILNALSGVLSDTKQSGDEFARILRLPTAGGPLDAHRNIDYFTKCSYNS